MNGRADRNRVVSSDDELLILVDDDDRETGSLGKGLCHDGDGVLHRAFSLFVFDAAGRLLLQKRAAGKRLWPLFWSNSCCSHPRKGESMDEATRRRIADELNVDVDLEFVYKFRYQARYRDLGSERELCWVYLGRCAGAVEPNATEIAEIRFVAPAELERELRREPQRFTPWFRMEWERLTGEFRRVLDRYIDTEQR